jgi:hypothetical protein
VFTLVVAVPYKSSLCMSRVPSGPTIIVFEFVIADTTVGGG